MNQTITKKRKYGKTPVPYRDTKAWIAYCLFIALGFLVEYNAPSIFTTSNLTDTQIKYAADFFHFMALVFLPFALAGGIPKKPKHIIELITVKAGIIVGGILFFGGVILDDFGMSLGPLYIKSTLLLFGICAAIWAIGKKNFWN